MEYNLEGKTVIVTGSNSGIGKAAAVKLARLGAHVVMACRSMSRGSAALQDVRHETGSERVELMQLDLSSRTSIRAFADAFRRSHVRLDVLIHNAANFDHTLKEPVLTPDGVEMIFATNHVGVFFFDPPVIGYFEG